MRGDFDRRGAKCASAVLVTQLLPGRPLLLSILNNSSAVPLALASSSSLTLTLTSQQVSQYLSKAFRAHVCKGIVVICIATRATND